MSAFHPLRSPPDVALLSIWGFYGMFDSLRAALLLALLVCGCSARPRDPHEQVMDRIESEIALPPGARPLRDYARYYAADDHGLVFAVYALPDSRPTGDESCSALNAETILANANGPAVPCPETSPEEASLSAGQRRWMSAPEAIPQTPDTLGCEQVTFSYDPRRNAVVTGPACSDQYQQPVITKG